MHTIELTVSHFSTLRDRAAAIAEYLTIEDCYFSGVIEDNLPHIWENEGDGKLYLRASDGVMFRLYNIACRVAPPGVNQVVGKEDMYSHSFAFKSVDPEYMEGAFGYVSYESIAERKQNERGADNEVQ